MCGCTHVVCHNCRKAGFTEPPAQCVHRGEELTGHQRHTLGLSSARWAPCSHPDRPKGEYVCPCRGCGLGCPGYVADPSAGGV